MRVHTASFAVVLLPSQFSMIQVVLLARSADWNALTAHQAESAVEVCVQHALVVGRTIAVRLEKWLEKVGLSRAFCHEAII